MPAGASSAPRWLQRVRSAVPLPADPAKQARNSTPLREVIGAGAIFCKSCFHEFRAECHSEAAPVHSSPGRVLRPNSGLVFARCVFSAPSSPDGPGIAPSWHWRTVQMYLLDKRRCVRGVLGVLEALGVQGALQGSALQGLKVEG